MKKILITESDNFSKDALKILQSNFTTDFGNYDRNEIIQKIPDFNVLWVRLKNKIDKETINAGMNLSVIVSPTTGLNHIDITECSKKNIHILSLKGEYDFLKDIRATAELTICLMLSLLRNIISASQSTISNSWNRDIFRGNEIYGKTIGIIGFGRLGKIVAKYLHAFDANILVYDPKINENSLENYICPSTLEYLLINSDIVTIHVDLTQQSYKFFDEKLFSLMKPDSILINTSRGELIDENELLKNLQAGHLKAAALDVLNNENNLDFNNNEIINYSKTNKNLLITPHIGGCTFESMFKTELFMAKKLCSFFNFP